jgi:hypothetical protein
MSGAHRPECCLKVGGGSGVVVAVDMRFTVVIIALASSVLISCDNPPGAAPRGAQQALEVGEPGPPLSSTRLLRRILVALEGRIPTIEEVEALQALPDDAAKQQALMAQVDASLTSQAFYQQMLTAGHDMMRTSRYINGNTDHPFWKGDLTGSLSACPAGTLHEGVLGILNEDYSPSYGDRTSVVCNDAAATITSLNPWWDPTSTIQLIGRAANTASTVGSDDCGHISTSLYGHNTNLENAQCGCGPAAHFCTLATEGYFHQQLNVIGARQRSVWEQPARYLAHLAWHDQSLDQLVVGNTTVGDLNMRHMDWRFGRQSTNNSSALDADPTWWRPETWTTPSSPDYPPESPLAWHEYVAEDLDVSRTSADVYFDPRVQSGAPEAMPAAGVLTMMATWSSFPRERVRGSRALEIFACRDFSPPPPEVHFPDYVNDPSTGGPCIACHTLIDPASIHFKRWGFIEYPGEPFMGGLSRHGSYADHPSYDESFKRFTELFLPDTKMTPVSAARIAEFPESRFIDFLPTDQTLLGMTSDGTIGPRGFGKMVIASGDFDACMARRLYEQFTGEKLVDGQDATRIRTLAQSFVDGGRRVRPFVRAVIQNPTCFNDPTAQGCEFFRGL